MSSLSKSVSVAAPHVSPRPRTVQGVRALIAAGHVQGGERLPAEDRLAAQFAVSRVTVRAALAQLERDGLIKRKRNHGCVVVGDSPGGGEMMANTLVLLSNLRVATTPDIFSGYSDAVHSGAMSMAREQQLNLLTIHSQLDDEPAIAAMLRSRPRGVVVTLWGVHDPCENRLCRKLLDSGIPVVASGVGSHLTSFDQVASDHAGGGYALTRLLIERGRKRILRLWDLPETEEHVMAHNLGYERAMTEAGLPPLPATYIEGLPNRVPESQVTFQQRMRCFAGHLVEHLRGPHAVDAIMVGTDNEVFPVAAACRLFGVADKIAITGYDNQWRDAFERQWEPMIPLATVDKDNHRIGEELVTLLLDRIAGKLPAERQIRLVPQRVVVCRSSSG